MAFPTVFSQVVKLIPRTEFEGIVAKYDADRGVRSLNHWTWLGALLFGQLTGHDSIRAIERVFAHGDPEMRKIGFGPVRKSTLADANHSRDLRVLEDLFSYCLTRAHAVGPRKNGFKFAGQVLAMDSTTIELCLELSPWARFHHGKGAAKLHTAIDIAGDLPQFAVVTPGNQHDIRVARENCVFQPGTTVVFDKGYIDFEWLNDLNQGGVWFVSRIKDNCQYKVLKCKKTDRTRGVICDQEIRLKSYVGRDYQGKLRKITYRDPDTGNRLTFITNRRDLASKTIADLYKARWKVELFFRTLKQHLRIKKFLGTSYQSVKAQILVALIAFLLIQILRFTMKSSISTPDAMAVLGTLVLLKEPLSRLMGKLPRVVRHPCGTQLVLNL